MGPFDVELARKGLEVYASVVSPEYDAMRARLVGNLATNEVSLGSLRAQEAQLVNNFQLVAGFMDLLPNYGRRTLVSSSGPREGLEAEDAHMARQVQANVIWLNEPYNSYDRYGRIVPHYIIGRHGNTSHDYDYGRGPVTHLLLFSAEQSDEPIKSITVWQDELEIAESAATQAAHKEYTPEQLGHMFNRDSGNLHLYAGDDSMRSELASYIKLVVRSRFRDVHKQVTDKGMKAKMYHGRYHGRLSDKMLAEYDVFSHLNHLAVAFGTVDQLDELLAKYGDAIPVDPVDEIVEQYPSIDLSADPQEVPATTD